MKKILIISITLVMFACSNVKTKQSLPASEVYSHSIFWKAYQENENEEKKIELLKQAFLANPSSEFILDYIVEYADEKMDDPADNLLSLLLEIDKAGYANEHINMILYRIYNRMQLKKRAIYYLKRQIENDDFPAYFLLRIFLFYANEENIFRDDLFDKALARSSEEIEFEVFFENIMKLNSEKFLYYAKKYHSKMKTVYSYSLLHKAFLKNKKVAEANLLLEEVFAERKLSNNTISYFLEAHLEDESLVFSFDDLFYLMNFFGGNARSFFLSVIRNDKVTNEQFSFIQEYYLSQDQDEEEYNVIQMMFVDFSLARNLSDKALSIINNIQDRDIILWMLRKEVEEKFQEDVKKKHNGDRWKNIIELSSHTTQDKKLFLLFADFDNKTIDDARKLEQLMSDKNSRENIAIFALFKNDIDFFWEIASNDEAVELYLYFLQKNDAFEFDPELLAKRLNKSSIDHHLGFSGLLKSRGFTEKAISHLKENIDYFAYNSRYLNQLGYFLVEQNKELEKAKKYLDRSIQIKPESVATWDSIAWYFYKKGQYEEALKAMAFPLEKGINDPDIAYHLGEIYYKLNNFSEAFKMWFFAVQIGEEQDAAKRAQKRIEEIVKKQAKNK